MTAGRNSLPLEKVLLQMDLSKGLDERFRTESGGDQSSLATTVNNLVQNQAGGWTKRIGTTPLFTLSNQRKLIQTPSGLAVVDSNNDLYHFDEKKGTLDAKNKLSEFRVSARYSSSASMPTTQRVLSSISNDDYDIVIHEGGPNARVTQSLIMSVFARESGTEHRYDITSMGGTSTNLLYAKMAFVKNSTIFHVWVQDSTTGDLYVTKVDTSAAWPNNSGSFTTVLAQAGAAETLRDVCGTSTGTVAVCGAGGAFSATASGLSIANQMTTVYQSCDSDGGNTYLLCDTGGVLEIKQTTDANIAVTTGGWTDALASTTNTANNPDSIAVAVDGNDVKICVMQHQSASATMGSTIPKILTYACKLSDASLGLVSTIYGWYALSNPFAGPTSAVDGPQFYCHLYKSEATADVPGTVGPHVVVNVGARDGSTFVKNIWLYSGSYRTLDSLRIAAVLDPYNGIIRAVEPRSYPAPVSTTTPLVRTRVAVTPNGSTYNICVASRLVARTGSFGFFTLTPSDYKARQAVEFGGNNYISGGVLAQYDGWQPVEQGFLDYPQFRAIDSGVAGNVNGLVSYVMIYKSISSNGTVSYSRVYGPVSVTVANHKVTIRAVGPHVSSRFGNRFGIQNQGDVTLELYRTVSGGTQYFLCSTSQTTSGTPSTQDLQLQATDSYFEATDNLTDAALQANPLLYRQPGTANTSLDRYPAPSCDTICTHKDRVFVVDSFGQRVYYSSFFVDGEAPWFSPAFSFMVHGGHGPITAICSMDGRLFIFKKDGVWVVDGDGPPENGGDGTEFSPPVAVATRYGCTDPRSLVVTPIGIMYRSSRGIELLNRSLQVQWIGDRVKVSLPSYPITTAAIMDKDGRVRFMCVQAEDGSGTGKEFVYDTNYDCWSTATYKIGGAADVPVFSADRFTYNGAETVVLSTGSTCVRLNESTFLDDTYYVPWQFETSYVRPAGMQGRFQLNSCMVLGKRISNHGLRVSLDFDYEGYTLSKCAQTWQPSELKQKTLVEVIKTPTLTQFRPVSVRAKVEDIAPTDTTSYPVTTGQGMDLLGITFNVSPMAGAQFVAPFRKG